MKRIIALAVAIIVLISSCAFADEVTFRGIPWGSDVEALEKALKSDGVYISSMDGFAVPYPALFKISHSKQGFVSMQDGVNQSREEIGWFTTASYMTPLKVAGYDVQLVSAYSFYGLSNGIISEEKKDSVFYAAEYTFDVRDKEAAYKDLKEKLTVLYGNPIEIEDKASLTSYAFETPTEINAKMFLAVWNIRSDDVSVILNMEYNDGAENDVNAIAWYNCLTLSYVKTSYESQIQQVDAIMGGYLDNAEKENAVFDFDGL